ncbi:MAG: hypothetical protein JSR69_13240 [Proteobacteria bacterium]|nr:hypothetical protein [Pseudomonadota bacterium]
MRVQTPVVLAIGMMVSLSVQASDEARLPGDAAAVQVAAADRPFKLSLGEYRYGGNFSGQDVNLRYRRGDSSVWLGAYRDRDFGSQGRAGVDTSWQPFEGSTLALQPSLQWASGGFWGGSFSIEVGEPWFVQAGIGRTNTKPYFNLNFDPNDALSLAAGYRDDSGRTYYLMAIRDDRLGTHQQHVHAVARWPVGNGQRVTVDVLRKTGIADSGPVEGWGLSLGYDFRAWFLHLAYEPWQNFSDVNATRLTVGFRF